MKILLDECVDVDVRLHLPGHDAFTVTYMRWKGLKNGALLRRAIGEAFAAFVTTDRGVGYEQHVAGLAIAAFVLHSVGNDLESIEPLLPALLIELNHARPGTVTHIYPP